MTGIALNQVPGWREAVKKARAKQERIRENAWKNLAYEINGFKVRPMTVLDYLMLDHFGSPFLYRQQPQLCDLSWILWALSPQCLKWNQKNIQLGRTLASFFYSRKVSKKLGRDGIFQESCTKVFEYIDDMFMDAPAGMQGGKAAVCYLASWFDIIQSQYHCSEDAVRFMPLPQMFQRIRAIQERNGNEQPAFDKVEDRLKQFVQNGISSRKFSYDDLVNGKVSFELN